MRLVSVAGVVMLGMTVGSLSAVALTTTEMIGQQGRKFSAASISVRKGQPVTFLNDDNVPHNVLSLSAGNEFDLGSQPPGTSTDVSFAVAGEVEVICAIHPRMKMIVNVTQ